MRLRGKLHVKLLLNVRTVNNKSVQLYFIIIIPLFNRYYSIIRLKLTTNLLPASSEFYINITIFAFLKKEASYILWLRKKAKLLSMLLL